MSTDTPKTGAHISLLTHDLDHGMDCPYPLCRDDILLIAKLSHSIVFIHHGLGVVGKGRENRWVIFVRSDI